MFCKNCIHWDKKTKLGQCKSPKWKYGYHYSMNDISDNEIIVEDDEDWGCYTGPKFGCIHFKAKDS